MQPIATSVIREPVLAELMNPMGLAHSHQERRLGTAKITRVKGPLQWHEADASVCRLVFQCASRSVLSPAGAPAEAQLTAGNWAAQVSAPLGVQTWWGSETVVIAFPATLLSRNLLLQIQATPGAAMRTRAAAQMCLELARTCIAQAEPVSEAVGATLGDSLAELATLAIIEQSSVKRVETVRETLRTRILGVINRNLADPDLTIERIAEHMNCTKRYLHKVFSEEGETLSQYIWSRRLELCRAQLVRPDLSGKSITEIAFACGFNNAAHFSRSFRARFGESPRTFRRAALDARRYGRVMP
jgi:AraC-like DNA-binding protein